MVGFILVTWRERVNDVVNGIDTAPLVAAQNSRPGTKAVFHMGEFFKG